MTLYNGWFVINKPRGMGSTDVVQKLRRIIGKENKVGHAGTLDPLAHGVLPIAVGEATKTVQYCMNEQKEYEFTVVWGEERTTGDAEGDAVNFSTKIPSDQEIKDVIPSLIGDVMQVPPIYSAIKINGKPAYQIAREGKEVELVSRRVRIDDLQLMFSKNNTSHFKVLCGKGTYVRSLAVDIAKLLGTYAYVNFLQRNKVGNFLISDAIILANLEKIVHNGEVNKSLLPVFYGLGDILAVEVTAAQAKSLKNGLKIFLQQHSKISCSIIQILCNGVLQAMASIESGVCKPLRVFNL
jgi:tRNA pseudouridine55 synthase